MANKDKPEVVEIRSIAQAGDLAHALHQEASQEAEVGLYLSAMAKLNRATGLIEGCQQIVNLTKASVKERAEKAKGNTWNI